MRLKVASKAVVMGNIDLLRHCNSIGVDQVKLKKCDIERMGTNFVFVLSKEGTEELAKHFLEYDLETQPDVVLIMKVDDNGNISFEETSKTTRILLS